MKPTKTKQLTAELDRIYQKLVRDNNQWDRSPEGIKAERKAKAHNRKYGIKPTLLTER